MQTRIPHARTPVKDTAQKAILQTLIYSDLFDFPLTHQELWTYLKSNAKVTKRQFLIALRRLVKAKKISQGKYLTLPDRQALMKQRDAISQINKDKHALAKLYSHLLAKIPTIKYIGISGSVAMNNAKKNDDIDLFIITSPYTLWLTRGIVLFLLERNGKRRRKNDIVAKNKCCVNMLITEDNLSFPQSRHDVYTAQEIAQLFTLYNNDHVYERFITANSWIHGFLPNIPIPNPIPPQRQSQKHHKLFWILDLVAQMIQLFSIKKTQTTETIERQLVAFHPQDNRIKTLARYSKAQNHYKN